MVDLIPHPLILPLGIAMGVLIAAPVGPVNILCIQRTIERGMIGGILAGLGAVLGDGLISLLAALGVGQVTGLIASHRAMIQTIGGIVMIAFGLKVATTKPQMETSPDLKRYAWDVPQTFFLTVSNPGAVLGVFALFGLVSTFIDVTSTAQALWLVAAVAAGSLLWWVALSAMVGRIRHHLSETRLAQINLAAGWLLIAFGAVLIAEIPLKRAGFSWRALMPV